MMIRMRMITVTITTMLLPILLMLVGIMTDVRPVPMKAKSPTLKYR